MELGASLFLIACGVILLCAGLLGGGFKIVGYKVPRILSKILRIVASILGVVFLVIGLQLECNCLIPSQESKEISIDRAVFQIPDATVYCNATSSIKSLCEGKLSCSIVSDLTHCGDPRRGTRKILKVTYSCGSRGMPILAVHEGLTETIDCSD
ncbi:hypothetical protein KFE80_07935 [bacterium SCSIO 12696]|nr:hypothetical protein KFE80_07935 [bacterium SCSIO 12696]